MIEIERRKMKRMKASLICNLIIVEMANLAHITETCLSPERGGRVGLSEKCPSWFHQVRLQRRGGIAI